MPNTAYTSPLTKNSKARTTIIKWWSQEAPIWVPPKPYGHNQIITNYSRVTFKSWSSYFHG